MAITYELIGQLGGGASEATEHPAVFSDGSLVMSRLATDITVDSDCAVMVKAPIAGYASGSIIISGESFPVVAGPAGTQAFWRVVRGVNTVQIRATGSTAFTASPQIVTIKIR